MQFLPEGGQLVAGLASRVAFKAVSRAGVGVDVSGFVLDSKKDTVVGFQSQHLGMGTFPFMPEAGQTYTAFARLPGTTSYSSYTMPAPVSAGYTLQVDNLGNKDNIRVYVSSNLPAAQTQPESGSAAAPAGMLTVLAQVNGQPVHAARGPAHQRGVRRDHRLNHSDLTFRRPGHNGALLAVEFQSGRRDCPLELLRVAFQQQRVAGLDLRIPE